jgi:hypothetical protein
VTKSTDHVTCASQLTVFGSCFFFCYSEMDCRCGTADIHYQLAKAHLCGPLEPLSQPPSRPTTPPHFHPAVKQVRKTLPFSYRALLKKYNRQQQSKRRLQDLLQAESQGHCPNFYSSPSWHLDNARRCTNGYKGVSSQKCETIPHIPDGSNSAAHLEILQQNGYKIVPAPKWVILSQVRTILLITITIEEMNPTILLTKVVPALDW